MTVRSDVEEKEISTDKNSKYFRTRDRFSYSAIKPDFNVNGNTTALTFTITTK